MSYYQPPNQANHEHSGSGYNPGYGFPQANTAGGPGGVHGGAGGFMPMPQLQSMPQATPHPTSAYPPPTGAPPPPIPHPDRGYNPAYSGGGGGYAPSSTLPPSMANPPPPHQQQQHLNARPLSGSGMPQHGHGHGHSHSQSQSQSYPYGQGYAPVYDQPQPPPQTQPQGQGQGQGHVGYNPSYGPPPGHGAAPPVPPFSGGGGGGGGGGGPGATYTYFLGVAVTVPGKGVGQRVDYDPGPNIEKIRKATKGFGTDEMALITVLTPLDALYMDVLRTQFEARVGKSLEDVVGKETGGWFRFGLQGMIQGPLGWDAELVRTALAGVGTHEDLLTELVLSRPNAELHLLKQAYTQKFGGRGMEGDVRGDLSGKTERLFTMALAASRTPDDAPVDHGLVARDVEALYKAGPGKLGTDEIEICTILVNRSQQHLYALCGAYQGKYSQTLGKMIKKEFSGHMKDALLYIVEGAKKNDGGVHRDAKMMEKAMAGLGTKDQRLVWRIVRAHWNRPRMEAIKQAYERKYGKSLASRVRGETSGAYRKLMLALIG